MRRVPLALALLAAAPFAAAQASNVRLGASVNGYFFADSKLRDAFGNPALTYGVNLSTINRPSANRLTFAYDIITADRGDSRIFVLPFTVGYEKQFADRNASLLPYFRVDAGVSYYDIALHDGGQDTSFKSWGGVGGAEVGVVFNKTVALKAKYYLFQSREGISFSGFEVGLVYNFGRL